MNSGSWNLSPPVFSFKIFCSSTFPLHYTKVSPFWCVYGWERSTFFCSTKVFLALVIFFISILAPILLYYSAHLEFLNYTSGCLWFAGGCFLSSPILFLTGPPYRSLIFFSLVIRILSLGGNPVTVDENVDAQTVNSQAFNGRNVTL